MIFWLSMLRSSIPSAFLLFTISMWSWFRAEKSLLTSTCSPPSASSSALSRSINSRLRRNLRLYFGSSSEWTHMWTSKFCCLRNPVWKKFSSAFKKSTVLKNSSNNHHLRMHFQCSSVWKINDPLPDNLIPLKQIGQLKGMPFLWISLCLFKVLLSLNAFSHSSHLNGFSPVCVRWCANRWAFWVKARPHSWHLNHKMKTLRSTVNENVGEIENILRIFGQLRRCSQVTDTLTCTASRRCGSCDAFLGVASYGNSWYTPCIDRASRLQWWCITPIETFFLILNIFLSKQIHVKFIKRNFRCFEGTVQWQYNFCVPVCVRLCLGSWFWVVKHFPQISHLYGRSPVCVRMWIWKQEAKHDSHFLPQCYIFITVIYSCSTK